MEVCPLGVSLIEGYTVLSLDSKCAKRVTNTKVDRNYKVRQYD